MHSCSNTLPPCLPAFQQQHTNQHCNVRDLNYSPALTYLQGVWELGVEQILLQGKWQPCGYGNHFETTVQGPLPLLLSSPFLLPLSLFPCCFRVVRVAVMMVKGPDWRGHCPAACGQTVSSERQIDVCPPCARTHTHRLSQPCVSIGTSTHACTRLASWQMYTLWLIAEREREKCEDWH